MILIIHIGGGDLMHISQSAVHNVETRFLFLCIECQSTYRKSSTDSLLDSVSQIQPRYAKFDSTCATVIASPPKGCCDSVT